jgi:DNA repair protein RadC
MHIRDWPEHERPREKLFARGSAVLSDAELLAIFLGSGTRGQTAVDTGRALLLNHAGLRGLLDLSAQEMAKLKGIGPARACALKAALELGHRHLAHRLARGEVIDSPRLAGEYFARRLRAYPHEVFACLLLDNRHHLIAYEELFRGSIDSAEVHPREVLKLCLKHNAAAIMLAHNHPSGHPQASAADRALTQRLKQATALLDIRLLDHFIIGDGPPSSMAEQGLL